MSFSTVENDVLSSAEEKGVFFCYSSYDETKSNLIIIPSNVMYVLVEDDALPVDFWIYFTSTEKGLLNSSLSVNHTSNVSGHITLPGYVEGLNYPLGLDQSYQFDLPEFHVIMISFLRFQVNSMYTGFTRSECFDYLELYEATKVYGRRLIWRRCGMGPQRAEVYNTSMIVTFKSSTNMKTFRSYLEGIFLRFSFHMSGQAPEKLPSSLFSCSGYNYKSFREHLDCNLRIECEGEEDEAMTCPYSSAACPGFLAVKEKCIYYQPRDGRYRMSWSQARQTCQKQGGDIAMLKSGEELAAVGYMAQRGFSGLFLFIGLVKQTTPSTSLMYRSMWGWADGDPCFYKNMSYDDVEYSAFDYTCSYIVITSPVMFYRTECFLEIELSGVLCEKRIHKKASSKTKSLLGFMEVRDPQNALRGDIRLFACPEKHFTIDYLACDQYSHCGVTVSPTHCQISDRTAEDRNRTKILGSTTMLQEDGQKADPTALYVRMFECDTNETVHYTLVCDFNIDCADGSDESRCVHKHHDSSFRCNNGQIIDPIQVCDMRTDCYDMSDEAECIDQQQERKGIFYRKSPPVIIHFDGRGNFSEEPLDPANPRCPATHFTCPGSHLYCMPVYLRCNGINDCAYGEDEAGCKEVTCPGYFRCRSSSVCLHVSHVCDGWPQCPEREDEEMCNSTCPIGCKCQGLAFVCLTPFLIRHYPKLRYLDAAGSGLAPRDVEDNFHLVYLSLADCALTTCINTSLPNLQLLDLSHNKMVVFHMHNLFLFNNLRFLSLRGNPLTTIISWKGPNHTSLLSLDLSNTLIYSFDSDVLSITPSIQNLNLSFSMIKKIEKGFSLVKQLVNIDVRGCDIQEFPSTMFESLMHLRIIYSSNYKLCCKATLPAYFNTESCFAPLDEVSSCEDLLRSNFYRIFLWIIGPIAVFGNAASLLFKLTSQKKMLKSGYNVFVVSLSCSDLCMGVYLVILGAADGVYRGQFLWYENLWKNSIFCTTAGFLAFFSVEVTSFVICLITLDRFLVIHFPFNTLRFKGKSAVMAAVSAWLLGIILATVPMFPGQAHWGFYSQTSVCIPLPITKRDFPGKSYSFGVLIVLDFAIFMLIAAGQGVLYWSIQSNAMTLSDATSKSHNLTIARRLVSVVVADFLCWFPIGVLGLAAFCGTAVPGEVNVAMAVFVLPLNSALNPFLYTYNVLAERSRVRQETKLLKALKEQLLQPERQATQSTDSQPLVETAQK